MSVWSVHGLDIETIPNPDMEKHLSMVSARKKMSKKENMALYPEFGRVASYAIYGKDKKNCHVVRDLTRESEVELITDCLSDIGRICNSFHSKVVGYNSKRFDLPFLFKRASILGIDTSVTTFRLPFLTNKYNTKWHVDMKAVIGGGDPQKEISLALASKIYLNQEKVDFDVTRIAELIKDGDIFEMQKYNLNDAKLAHDLYYTCIGLVEEN